MKVFITALTTFLFIQSVLCFTFFNEVQAQETKVIEWQPRPAKKPDVMIVQKGQKFGLVSSKGKPLCPCVYDSIADFAWKTSENKALRVPLFHDGMVPAQRFKNYYGRRWGFLNSAGEESIPCQYEKVRYFAGGRAPVAVKVKKKDPKKAKHQPKWGGEDGKDWGTVGDWGTEEFVLRWGYVDARNTKLKDFTLVEAYSAWQGCRLISQGSGWAYCEGGEKRELPHSGTSIRHDLHPELAVFGKNENTDFFILKRFPQKKYEYKLQDVTDVGAQRLVITHENKGKILKGLLDTGKGKWIVKPEAESIIPLKAEKEQWLVFKNGKSFIADSKGKALSDEYTQTDTALHNGMRMVYDGEKYGFLNTGGQLMISPRFIKAKNFAYGAAPVRTEKGWALIGKDGKLRCNDNYSSIEIPSDGLVKVKRKNKTGILKASGEVLIKEGKFDFLGTPQNGMIRIKKKGLYGFLTKTGAKAIKPEWRKARDFKEGAAAVYNGKKWGFIRKKGGKLISCRFDRTEDFKDGYALTQTGSQRNILNKDGELLLEKYCTEITRIDKVTFKVKTKEGIGLFNAENKRFLISPGRFDGDFYPVGNFIWVRKGKKWGLVSNKGRKLTNLEYDSPLVKQR